MGKHRDEVPFIVSGCARFAFIQTVRGIFAGKARSAVAATLLEAFMYGGKGPVSLNLPF